MSTPENRIYHEPSARNSSTGSATPIILMALFLLALIMSVWAVVHSRSREAATVFPTPYQAILLSNGAVYFGKLEGYGTPHPVLTDAFYIVNQTNPQTKETSSVLVKRGKELHGPDRMYLSPGQIVFVETVGTNSKVAQLISSSN